MTKISSGLLLLFLLLLGACSDGGGGAEFTKASQEGNTFTGVATIRPSSALYNPMPSSVAVTFPTEVDMASVGIEDFTVITMGSCPPAPLLSISKTGHVATLLLDTVGCANTNWMQVKANMAEVKNAEGKIGIGWNEVLYTLNTDSASAPSLNLTSGSYRTLPGSFTILYNNTIDMNTVTSGIVSLSGTGGCSSSPMTGFSKVGYEVTVTYDTTGCSDGDTITVEVNNSLIEDLDGRKGSGIIQRELKFDTVGVNASAVTFNTPSGDINPLPASVTVTFPSDINMDSVALSDFVITGTGSCPSPVLIGLTKSGHTAQLTFNSTGCTNGDAIQFLLPMSAVSDYAGNPGTGSVTSSWRLLNSAPATPSWNIAAGTVAQFPLSLVLDFDDTIDMSTVNNTSIQVTSTGACPVVVLSTLTKNGSEATLSLNSTGCVGGDSITISLDMSHVENTVGTAGTGIITKTFTLDTQGPAAPLISVDTGYFSQLPQQVLAVFGSDTKMSTVNSTTIVATGSGSCPGNALNSIAISGQNANINLDTTGCTSGDKIDLQIKLDQITDLVGNAGASTITKTFTMDSSIPSSPTLNLSAGAVVTLPTTLQFQFDGSIDMSTVSAADFIVLGSGGCLLNPVTNITKTGGLVELTLSNAGCVNNDSFIVTLDMSGITNTTGTAGSGTFRNIFIMDNQGPAQPTSTATGGNVASFPSSLSFDFPQDTNMSTVSIADFAAIGTGACSATSITGVTVLNYRATVAFDSSSCVSGDALSVKAIMSGITDALGNAGTGEAVVSFTLDTAGPVLPIITPATATMASMPTSLSINFSNDTLMSSVGTNDFSFTGSGSCSGSVTSMTPATHSAVVVIATSGCSNGDTLTFKVSGPGITDALGNAAIGTAQATYTLDNQGISFSSVAFSPVGSTVNALPTVVTVTFPADTDMDSVEVGDFSSITNGTCPANVITGISKTGTTATLSLNTFGCLSSNTVSLGLNVSQINDTYGNAGTGSLMVTYTLDNIGPQAASFSLASATVSAMPTTLALTFSSDTQMSSVTTADISVTGTGACAASMLSSLTQSGQVANLALDPSLCVSGDTLTVTLNMTGVTDALGNAGSGSPSVTFTMDNVGPLLPTVSLVSGTVATLPTTVIYTFTADTDMNSVTVNDFSASGTGGCAANPITSLSKAGQFAAVNLSTTGCANGSVLTLNFDMTGVTDTIGNAGTGTISRSFTLDNVGPAAAMSSVTSGTRSVLPATVDFTFSSDTDMTSVGAADFTAIGSGSCPANALTSVSITGQVATISLNSTGCVTTNSIAVALAMTGVTDALGNAGTGTLSYTYILDNTGPANAVNSLATSTLSALPASVNLTFTSDTDMSSVTVADFTAVGSGSCPSNALSGISKSGQVATVSFNRTGCVSGDTITLALDMTGVTDSLSNAGVGTLSYIYTLDSTGPANAVNSLASATMSALPATLTFTFSSDTDMNSVTSVDFTAVGSGSCPTNALGTVTKSGQVATVNLNRTNCANSNKIDVTLAMTGVTDALSNAGTGTLSYTYTLDNVGPTIAVGSLASATLSTLPSSVNFTFSSDTDMNSVTAADFSAVGSGSCPANALSSITKSGQVATVNLDHTNCVSGNKIDLVLSMTGVTDDLGNAGAGTLSYSYTLDTMGPASATNSLASSTLTVLPAFVNFTFSSDTDMSSVTAADFTAVGNGSCPANAFSSISKSGQVATISFNRTGCANGNKIDLTLDMSGITDDLGNAASGTLTYTYTLDNVGPAAAVNSLASATMTSLPTSVNFTFSSDTDMSSVTAADFTAVGSGSCPSNALSSISKSGQVATVNFNRTSCASGNKIDLTLAMTGVTDALGNAGVGTLSYTYTLDNVGPASATNALASASLTALPGTLSFTFASDTDMNSVTSGDFTVVGNGSCPASPLTGFSITGLVATLTLDSSNCITGNKIDVTLAMTGVTDALGNAGSGTLSYTYTLDNTGPAAAANSLASATLVTLPASLSFTFSSDTDMNSVTSADFTALGSGACPANALGTVTKSGQVATVNLVRTNCASGNNIVVSLAMTGVTDALGNAGSGTLSYTYTMDNTGPAAASNALASATLSALPSSLTFTFSSDTDMNSVTSADFTAVGSGSCPANALGTVTKSGQVATVNLVRTNCAHGNKIDVTLAMTGVTDALGNAGTGSLSYTYTLDSVGPASAVGNIASATLMSLPASVNFTFSADTDMSTVTIADFTAVGSGSCLANALSSISKSGQVATVNLDRTGCVHGNKIDVTLAMAGVTDGVGNAGSGSPSYSYTLDTQGPANPTVNVTPGFVANLPNALIFTFAADVNMSTVSAADFTIDYLGLCTASTITGVTISGNTATVSVQNYGCILYHAYRINVLMPGIQDQTGNAGTGSYQPAYERIL